MNTLLRLQRSRRSILLCPALLLASGLAALAQSAAPADATNAPAAPAPKDQPIVLNPFTVDSANDNNGYRTNTTTSGSLIATPLVDLPLTIDVINREFMDDAHSLTVADAARFFAGVAQANKNEYDTESFVIRGFTTIDELRNGIFFHGFTDETNIERVEAVKGPAAVLYGIVEPGGIINYTTKQPMDTPLTALKYSFGSYDYNRVDLDLNQPLDSSNTLLFRIPTSYTTANSFQKYVHTNALFTNPTLTFKPTPKTSITFDYTYRRDEGTWNRGGAMTEASYSPDGSQTLVAPQPISGLYAPYAGAYTYGQVGPQDYSSREHTFGEIRLEQAFTANLSLEAEVSQENLRMTDTGGFMRIQPAPGFESNFYQLNLPPSEMVMFTQNFIEKVKEVQRHFEINLFAKQTFGDFSNKLVLGMQGNEAPTDEIDFFWPGFVPTPAPLLAADSQRFNRGNFSSYVPWFSFQDPIITNLTPSWETPDLYATDQFSGFDNKLHILGGLRRQTYSDLGTTKLVPQIGAIYALTKSLSAYATYSESERSNGIDTITNQVRPLEQAKGFDAGLKTSFLDGKVEGSVTYFDITKQNVAYADLTSFINQQTGQLVGNDTEIVAGQEKSKGVEAEMQIRPFDHTQVSLNYSHDDAHDTKDDPRDQGAQLPGAIKDEVTLLAKYRFAGGPLDRLEIGGGGIFTFGNVFYYLPSNAEFLNYQHGAYQDLTAFVHYDLSVCGKPVNVGVSCKNFTNKHYMNATLQVADPREWFASVEVHF